jgi:Cu-processing system permease protein
LALGGGGSSNPASYAWLVGLAWVLSLAMLSVGFLISSLTQRASVAIGVGLFLWLVFVFLGDLGLMGASITLRMPIANLFWVSLVNPLQVFKMGAILSINATLDVLGPAGIYGMQKYGDGLFGIFLAVLALWIVMPALLAWLRFARRNDF